MATPEQLAEFNEACSMVRSLLSAAEAAGIPRPVMFGAMTHQMAAFFVAAEERGISHKAFDDLMAITTSLVHKCRG